jgi:putative endonuclease
MKTHCYSVSIVASKSRVIYIGMTNDLSRRVYEHKNDLTEGFSKQYRCHRLVYYESSDDVNKAIDREKQLKRWSRKKKIWLIERRNLTWEDLAAEWFTRHMHEPEKQVPPLASRLLRSSTDSVGMTNCFDFDAKSVIPSPALLLDY